MACRALFPDYGSAFIAVRSRKAYGMPNCRLPQPSPYQDPMYKAYETVYLPACWLGANSEIRLTTRKLYYAHLKLFNCLDSFDFSKTATSNEKNFHRMLFILACMAADECEKGFNTGRGHWESAWNGIREYVEKCLEELPQINQECLHLHIIFVRRVIATCQCIILCRPGLWNIPKVLERCTHFSNVSGPFYGLAWHPGLNCTFDLQKVAAAKLWVVCASTDPPLDLYCSTTPRVQFHVDLANWRHMKFHAQNFPACKDVSQEVLITPCGHCHSIGKSKIVAFRLILLKIMCPFLVTKILFSGKFSLF